MYGIKEIYETRIGTTYQFNGYGLRNDTKFAIDDHIFIGFYDGTIAVCKVIGVEKTDSENPDYIYKVKVPKGIIGSVTEDEQVYSVACDKLFKTIEDAKSSALSHTELMYKQQKGEIESYFNQFNK